MKKIEINNHKIAIIGLGYVGLPLAVEFSKKYKVIGYDISQERITSLKKGIDRTNEISEDKLKNTKNLLFTNKKYHLSKANIFIITVPTPIDKNKNPDLKPLIESTRMVASIIKKGDIIIYESTVFPGCTEEICGTEIEKISNLKLNKDFYLGYSPERINPGDKEHTISSIIKVTSGSNKKTANLIDGLYKEIIIAGTHKASSIKVAEAAKVIENTQRDLKIALVNELALIFNNLDIDTHQVLEAASTKWNFMPFKPGLVGGHCIGVDPYYLTHKAEQTGYKPEVILAGRRINDSMGKECANMMIKKMIKKNINISKSKVLVLGFTFKENCPDIRNTRVIDIINELSDYNIEVDVHDPWVNISKAKEEYSANFINKIKKNYYHGIILATPHDKFKELTNEEITSYGKNNKFVFFDVKSVRDILISDIRL